jgi:hypothetical protein
MVAPPVSQGENSLYSRRMGATRQIYGQVRFLCKQQVQNFFTELESLDPQKLIVAEYEVFFIED